MRASPLCTVATNELVVPRSIPMASLCSCGAALCPGSAICNNAIMLFKLVLLALQQVINRQINCLQCVLVRHVIYKQTSVYEYYQPLIDTVARRYLLTALQAVHCIAR